MLRRIRKDLTEQMVALSVHVSVLNIKKCKQIDKQKRDAYIHIEQGCEKKKRFDHTKPILLIDKSFHYKVE